VIETHAVDTLAARVATDPDGTREFIDRLHGVIARMQRAVADSSFDDMVEADYEFHRLIISSCDNTLFGNIYDTLRAFMQEEIRRTNLQDAARAGLVEEHERILAGIASGDKQSALAAFDAHIDAVRQQLRQSLQWHRGTLDDFDRHSQQCRRSAGGNRSGAI
jgi:GntR family transcriptional repressor for pyruvate dehydrogenase complex